MTFDPSIELKELIGSLAYDLALLKAQNNALITRNMLLEERMREFEVKIDSSEED